MRKLLICVITLFFTTPSFSSDLSDRFNSFAEQNRAEFDSFNQESQSAFDELERESNLEQLQPKNIVDQGYGPTQEAEPNKIVDRGYDPRSTRETTTSVIDVTVSHKDIPINLKSICNSEINSKDKSYCKNLLITDIAKCKSLEDKQGKPFCMKKLTQGMQKCYQIKTKREKSNCRISLSKEISDVKEIVENITVQNQEQEVVEGDCPNLIGRNEGECGGVYYKAMGRSFDSRLSKAVQESGPQIRAGDQTASGAVDDN